MDTMLLILLAVNLVCVPLNLWTLYRNALAFGATGRSEHRRIAALACLGIGVNVLTALAITIALATPEPIPYLPYS